MNILSILAHAAGTCSVFGALRLRLPSTEKSVDRVVGFDRSDVVAFLGEEECIDGTQPEVPGEEVSRGIRISAAFEKSGNQRDAVAGKRIDGDACDAGFWLGGLLLEVEYSAIVGEDDAPMAAADAVAVTEVMAGVERFSVAAEGAGEIREAEAEDAVAGQDEKIIIESHAFERETQIAGGAEPSVVAERAVMQERHRYRGVRRSEPGLEGVVVPVVGDQKNIRYLRGGGQGIEKVADDRPARHRQESFRASVGQGSEPCRITGSEDDRCHVEVATRTGTREYPRCANAELRRSKCCSSSQVPTMAPPEPELFA